MAPKIDVLSKLYEVEKDLERLKSRVNTVSGIAGVIGVIWVIWVSSTLVGLQGDIKALKQASKDKGVDIVSQITHPTSLNLEKAALLTTTAGLERAIEAKTPPSAERLTAITHAVAASVSAQTPPREAWDTAATLINYKSAATIKFVTPPTRSCFGPMPNFRHDSGTPNHFNMNDVGCTIDLNDIQAFQTSDFLRQVRGDVVPGPVYLYINLRAATVKYDPSRPIINIFWFQCQECRYEVNRHDEPLPSQQGIVKQLLADTAGKISVGKNLTAEQKSS